MLTPQTIVDPETLQNEIQKVRARGWATAPNEAVTGLNMLAAPIFDASGQLVGTVGVVDAIQFVPEPPSDKQIRLIVDAGQAITRALGYSVPR